MKKLMVLVVAFAAIGCSRGSGVFEGKVVDASWEGWFFQTCEIDVQYGDQASKIARFSSESRGHCKKAIDSLGGKVRIRYARTAFICPTCGSGDLVRAIEVKP